MRGNWLREPLLHFLLAGGLLFAAHGWLDRGPAEAPRAVRITAAEVNWLKETWSRQWQRPPTEAEMRGLLADYLKEVLLAREAKEIGLDENDTVIRRRLAQKMEFIVQDSARLAPPDEAELRRIHAANPARYQTYARISLRQIFFKSQAAAQKALPALSAGGSQDVGDGSLLPRDLAGVDLQAVASQFGEQFGRQVFALEPGAWHGPLASTYGFHLVRIESRAEAKPRPFEEARAQVLDDWQRERQARADERFLAELMKKYAPLVDPELQSLLAAPAKDRP